MLLLVVVVAKGDRRGRREWVRRVVGEGERTRKRERAVGKEEEEEEEEERG